MSKTKPKSRRLSLQFRNSEHFRHVDDPVHKDLSAVSRAGDNLFFSCDETAGVDRLHREGEGWGDHRHYNLGTLLDLPAGPDGEMDIEGLDCDGDWLWVVGSHALKRDKPDDDDDPTEALEELAEIDRDPNRYFLGRIPLAAGDGGLVPAGRDAERVAAHLKMKKTSSKLVKWLKGDVHLDRFLNIPSKENGLDIEGIAARGMRVWLGLRGPVLRAHAVILEMQLKQTGAGFLKARRIDGKRRYRKHLLYTDGLGVRDLALDGEDLLVLAGTPLAGDGPARIFRWRDACAAVRSHVVPAQQLSVDLELPYLGPVDHPEGLAQMDRESWLVIHDSPAPDRLGPKEGQIQGDLVRLGRHRKPSS